MSVLAWVGATVLVGAVTALVGGTAAWIYRNYAGFDPESLRGARVLITGASAGVGEEMAYGYARLGAKVIITARREARLKKVTAAMRQLGAAEAVYVVGDMGKAEDCEKVIQTAEEEFGGLDYLILNHIGSSKALRIAQRWDLNPDMDDLIDYTNINYFSYVRLATLALPMLKENNANIVVVSSVIGKWPSPAQTHYAGVKFALDGFFSSLRLELKPHNVSVSLVVLGAVRTDFFRQGMQAPGLTEKMKTYITNMAVSAEDAAAAILKGAALRKHEIYYPAYTLVMAVLRPIIPEFLGIV